MTRTEIPGPDWASTWTRLALSELPADIATATPPQVDEVIRTARFDRQQNLTGIARQLDELHRAMGHRRDSEVVGTGRNRDRRNFWVDEEGNEFDTHFVERHARELQEHPASAAFAEPLAALDAIRRTDETIAGVLSRCTTEYDRRGGWTRYYRVNNSNGHVHKHTACKETYPTTQWNWPTHLSGATAEQVVDAAGALTCLTCFPEVRGSILEGRPPRLEEFETREQTADRRDREADRQAKRDAKIAKGVTPDGAPLVVRFDGHTNEIRTERAAELRYVDCAWDVVRTDRLLSAFRSAPGTGNEKYLERLEDEHTEYQAAVETLAEALAWKRGSTVADVKAALQAKVDKKIRANTY